MRAAAAHGRSGLLGPPLLAVLGAGGVLAGLSIYQAEFGFGVPQKPPVPANPAPVHGRACPRLRPGGGGGGAALAAVAMNIAISAGFTLVVGPIAARRCPFRHLPADGALRRGRGGARPERALTAFSVASGLLVGTAGTVGEWGWTTSGCRSRGRPTSCPPDRDRCARRRSGGLVGAFVARALGGPRRLRRRWAVGGSARWALRVRCAASFVCRPIRPPERARRSRSRRLAPRRRGRTRQSPSTRRRSSMSRTTSSNSPAGTPDERRGGAAAIGPGVYRTRIPLPLTGSGSR